MAKQLNIVGLKYNSLTVLEQLPSKAYGKKESKKRMWLCVCDCGKKTQACTGSLRQGKVKSCGCLHSIASVKNSLKTRHMIIKPNAAYTQIYNIYKRSAKDKNHNLNIDIEDFKKIITSNCFYCGIEPSRLYHKTVVNIYYNGIDRVDNNKGYDMDNIVACCRTCNVAKNNQTKDDFLKWVKRLTLHQLSQNNLEVLIQKEEQTK